MAGIGRLLFVDNNQMVLDIATRLLEPEGFEVLTSKSAFCSGTIIEKKPEVVFLEIDLAGLRGDTAGKALMTVPEIASGRCLVVFHSNMPEDILRRKVLETGVAGYMPKQDDPDTFVSEVRRWVQMARRSPGPDLRAAPSRARPQRETSTSSRIRMAPEYLREAPGAGTAK